jgi:hypothetical protein
MLTSLPRDLHPARARRPRWAAAVLVLLALLGARPAACLGQSSPESLGLQVETAFLQSMDQWAYRQFWTLWESGTREGRLAVTRDQFTLKMEQGKSRPAIGQRVEDTEVTLTSPDTALVLALLGLEDPGTSSVQFLERTFVFRYQDGRWCPQLSDFLGLAAYSIPQTTYIPGNIPVPCCPRRHPPRR